MTDAFFQGLMMDHTNNGGPAFPSPAEHFSDGTLSGHATYGMSLRDYFIAHAPGRAASMVRAEDANAAPAASDQLQPVGS